MAISSDAPAGVPESCRETATLAAMAIEVTARAITLVRGLTDRPRAPGIRPAGRRGGAGLVSISSMTRVRICASSWLSRFIVEPLPQVSSSASQVPFYGALAYAEETPDLGRLKIAPVGQHDHRSLPNAEPAHDLEDFGVLVRVVPVVARARPDLTQPPACGRALRLERLVQD